MTVPVGFETSMGSKLTMVRMRRRGSLTVTLYCGTVITVPYVTFCEIFGIYENQEVQI